MEEAPYWVRHGRLGDYWWLQSDGISIEELLDQCPQVIEGQYVVNTRFDSRSLVPFGSPPGVAWEEWQEFGLQGIIANAGDLNTQADDMEFYIFDKAPDPSSFAVLTEDEWDSDLSLGDEDKLRAFLELILQLGADAYIYQSYHLSFVTRNSDDFSHLLASKLVTEISTKKKWEGERRTNEWLATIGADVGPEKCAQGGCERLRMRFGVFCGSHHLDMLERTALKGD